MVGRRTFPIILVVVSWFFRDCQSTAGQRNRFRAAEARRNRQGSKASGSHHYGDGLANVDCDMRAIAYKLAMQRVPVARKHSASIKESLHSYECPNHTFAMLDATYDSEPHQELDPLAAGSDDVFVDCDNGDDNNDGNSAEKALYTLNRAQTKARASNHRPVTVHLCGTCYIPQNEPLRLTPLDSNMTWAKRKDCQSATISGGAVLRNLSWSRFTRSIWVADVPSTVNISAVDGLFTMSPTSTQQTRLIRARYPNGDPEIDRMPVGYDKFSGAARSVRAWEMAGNVSQRFPTITKNSSFYPWFGHSRDTRWVQDFHTENASSYYFDGNGEDQHFAQQFWQPTIATSVLYNNTHKMKAWEQQDYEQAVLHVIHYDWWGNWQWKVANLTGSTITFGDGGWQDAHGGPVSHNYFYVENMWSELDRPGEWYMDQRTRKLYYWPLEEEDQNDPSAWTFVATQSPILVSIRGNSVVDPVRNIRIEGITFLHTTTTYLSQRYTVPSAGDWSVLHQGSVTLQNHAEAIVLRHCTWNQVSGNAIALHGSVRDTVVSDGDFRRIGDSGVVVVGRLGPCLPYQETVDIPVNITISRCHFGQTGVFGKQTSALFVALAKRVSFLDNLLYDGPRAGININDGFGGGHVLARNIIFNQVLESGDHGPINTWSRSAYYQRVSGGNWTLTPEWNHIDNNFIMIGPKVGSLYGPGDGPCSNGDPNFYCPKGGGSLLSCLDHDDGSEYYLDTRNVCVFAGMKNYIGQNKIWDSNLIIHPEGPALQNRSSIPCLWTSMNMGGQQQQLPCSRTPCRTQEVFTNNTCITHHMYPLECDNWNQTDLEQMGNENTTIPLLANNTYCLNLANNNGSGYAFWPTGWNLTSTQRMGVEQGSRQRPIPSANDLRHLVLRWLHLDEEEEEEAFVQANTRQHETYLVA